MTRSVRILILALIGLLAACGGGGSPGEGSTKMAVIATGAQSVTFSETGGCGKALGDESSWGSAFTSPDGKWLLDATVEGTFDAGTYRVSDHEAGFATIFMTDGAGTTYDAMVADGTLTLDDGARSGNLDVTLFGADGTSLAIAGTFTCEDWD